MALCRFTAAAEPAAQWGWVRQGTVAPLDSRSVGEVLAATEPRPLSLREFATCGAPLPLDAVRLEAPVAGAMEVWAAGVTYESSKFARMAESESGGDFYAKVYVADRPELFFKATPHRCVGPGQSVQIRSDSRWNVPEPELAVLISAGGRILGFCAGNDMSSRDIEGANPLYLPQAKVYTASCALGPWIMPAETLSPGGLSIRMIITREGQTAFAGETSTARMRRTVEELAAWLFRENTFPDGVILLTGTGIIPPEEFTLLAGDRITIEIEGIGLLENAVHRASATMCGAPGPDA